MSSAKRLRGINRTKHRCLLQKNRLFFRPRLEALEDRCLPSTVNVWAAPAGPPSNWNNAANWSLGHVPISSEIATFNNTSQTFCSIDAPAAGTNTVSGLNITAQYGGQIQDTADVIIGTDGFAQAGGAFFIDFFMPGTTTITDAGNWSESVPPPFGGFLAGPGATVDFNSATSQTILDNNTQFFNLTHSGAGTLNLTAGPNPFLPVAGNLLNSNGTVDARGASLMIGGNWTDTSSVVNLNTVTFNPFSPAPQTISSNSDFNNLTYIGPPPALLQLLTPVTLTGNFTVSSGTFDANNQDMTVAGNWSNSGTVENTNNVTFNGGTGVTQLLDNGPMGSLNNVIHSGAGTLQLSNNSLIVTGTLDNTAGTLEANGLNLSITGLTTLGAGIVQNTGAADTITLSGGLNITGGSLATGLGTAILGANVTVTPAPFTLPAIDGNLDLGGANRAFTVNFTPNTSGLYIGAAISDGALTKDGQNGLVLLHANSYSGGTFINGGDIAVFADQALGPGTGGTTVAGGAFLDFINTITYTPHEPVILNGGRIGHAGVGTTASFGGPITLGADSVVEEDSAGLMFLNGPINIGGFNLFVDETGGVIFNGPINGANAGTLTLRGTGFLTINAAGNYGGGTTVVNGTLGIGNDNAIGTGALTLNNGTQILAVGGDHAIANPVTLGGAVTIAAGPNTLTLNGVVSGFGSLIVNGNLTLTGQNSYAGAFDGRTFAGTTVNGATLGVEGDRPVGNGHLTLNDGSILLSAGGFATVPNSITLNGSVTVAGSNNLRLSGDGGPISGTGSLTDSDSASLLLGGQNTNSYSGGTFVTAGSLLLGGPVSSLVNFLGTGPLVLNDGTTLGIASGTINNPVTLKGTSTITVLASATLNGVISGTGGFTLTGGGRLQLVADNTYSGMTTVNEAFLTVAGSQPSSAVVINSGGVLAGVGTVGVVTVNSGGELEPGQAFLNAAGILTTGNLQFNGGTFFVVINGLRPGTNQTQLRVNGTVNLGSGIATLTATGSFKPSPGDKVRLIDNLGASPISGFFAGLPEGTIENDPTLGRLLITYKGGDGNDFVLIALGRGDIIGRVSSNGQWWLGASTGSSFTSSQPLTWSTGVTWVDVVTGDFNGDGFTDIAGRAKETGDWWVSLSNGSGGFNTTKWATWSTGATWVDVKIGDFNGDGKADIVGRALENGQWYVGLSMGTSFTTTKWATWSTGATWVDVKVGDFSGDGKADIAARALQNGQWYTGISNGSTAFNTTLWATWSTAATWVDVQVGDFNGDGKADITARYLQGGSWWTALSNGSAFVTSPAPWATWSTGATWVDVKVGDFNGDGKTDIIGRALENGQWYVGLSNGSNGFTTTRWNTWSTGATWVDVQVGDFNGDGKSEIAGRASQNGQWYVGQSNGTAFSTSLWAVWSTAVSWVDVREGAFV